MRVKALLVLSLLVPAGVVAESQSETPEPAMRHEKPAEQKRSAVVSSDE